MDENDLLRREIATSDAALIAQRENNKQLQIELHRTKKLLKECREIIILSFGNISESHRKQILGELMAKIKFEVGEK